MDLNPGIRIESFVVMFTNVVQIYEYVLLFPQASGE